MTTKNLTFNLKKLATLFLTSLLISSGCTTSSYSTYDYDYSITDIQKAIADNLPSGLGATNANKRVFFSKKFTQKQDQKNSIPLVMRVVINGDQRPYDLDFEVKKVSPAIQNVEYAFDAGDPFLGQISLAKRVATKINEQLALRRKNKNIFDDFKPF